MYAIPKNRNFFHHEYEHNLVKMEACFFFFFRNYHLVKYVKFRFQFISNGYNVIFVFIIHEQSVYYTKEYKIS